MALTVWGLDAGGGPYAAITALTNIPATVLAAVLYETFLADYSRSEYYSGSYGHSGNRSRSGCS